VYMYIYVCVGVCLYLYIYIYRVNPNPIQASFAKRRKLTELTDDGLHKSSRYHDPTWGIRGAKKKNTILYFILRLNMEYPRAYKWNIIEYPLKYNIIFHLGLPQEYPYSYSPRRATTV